MKKRYIQAPILLGSPPKDSYIYHKIMKLVDILKEIKVLSPSSFRVEVYPNDEDFEENYIAKSYFNNTLLDDNVTVNTEAGYIYLYIPRKIYNTIKNQLPPHETTANPSVDNTIGVMIRDINKVNIIYKEDPLNEIIVNKPGKPFKFVVTKKNTIVSKDARKGELYFKGKLIDDDAYFDGKWIIAYVDFDQENLQKDIEPYISVRLKRNQYKNQGKFFRHTRNSNGDNVKEFHIEGDQLKNHVDMVDDIKEIKVLSPTPKFTNNEQLSLYLKEHPKFRGTLVDKIVKDIGSKPYPNLTEQQWLGIIQDWKTKPDGMNYEQYVDEITSYSELGVNLRLSLDPMEFQDGVIVFGTNTFNYEYTVI